MRPGSTLMLGVVVLLAEVPGDRKGPRQGEPVVRRVDLGEIAAAVSNPDGVSACGEGGRCAERSP